jgi:hypothetical protein
MDAPSPLAGKPVPESILVDVSRLITAYREQRSDPSVAGQRVAHVDAIVSEAQAILSSALGGSDRTPR